MSSTITSIGQASIAAPSGEAWRDWRWQMRHRIRSLAELLEFLGLEPSIVPPGTDLLARFPLGVSRYYASLARRGDPDDPIVKQILPTRDEDDARGQEVADPFLEDEKSPVPGVIHRYRDRALILPTNYCATLCRHCFRKRSWSDGFYFLDRATLARAVDYLRATPSIRDVLITGGDPLHLAAAVLGELLADLRSIERLEVIRVASRMPVTLPQRIDDALLEALRPHRPLWFITHFNHVAELAPLAIEALRRLIDSGLTVLNQTVLLRGVNDTTAAQLDLARGLLKVGVRPYYLHVADPVAGAGHFRTSIDHALSIVKPMHGQIAGFGIPRVIVDLPGGKGKVPLSPSFELERDGDRRTFESPIDGSAVDYLGSP